MTPLTSHDSANGQTPIPYSRFRSDELPAADRFDAWSDSIAPMFRPYVEQGITAGDFSVATDAFLLGQLVLASTHLRGVGGCYNPGATPLRDSADIIVLIYFTRCGFSGYNGAQTIKATTGDIVVLDPSRGLAFAADASSHGHTLIVPRQLFAAALGKRLDIQPRLIAGASLQGEILGHALRSTWQKLPQLSQADAGGVSDLLLGAITGMLRNNNDSVADSAVDHATLSAICAYIERHLADPELGPAQLCKRFHCSRARLYRLFAPLDGVANYIRKARLERCRAALLTASRRVNISEVALAWGFGSVSHFNRLFRDTYGVAPGELRGNGTQPGVDSSTRRAAARNGVPQYREWLEQL